LVNKIDFSVATLLRNDDAGDYLKVLNGVLVHHFELKLLQQQQ